jgi:hypothetical protein
MSVGLETYSTRSPVAVCATGGTPVSPSAQPQHGPELEKCDHDKHTPLVYATDVSAAGKVERSGGTSAGKIVIVKQLLHAYTCILTLRAPDPAVSELAGRRIPVAGK